MNPSMPCMRDTSGGRRAGSVGAELLSFFIFLSFLRLLPILLLDPDTLTHHTIQKASDVLACVAVVGNEAGGALDVLADGSAGSLGKGLDEAVDLVDVGDALEGHEVGSQTGNVGGG